MIDLFKTFNLYVQHIHTQTHTRCNNDRCTQYFTDMYIHAHNYTYFYHNHRSLYTFIFHIQYKQVYGHPCTCLIKVNWLYCS